MPTPQDEPEYLSRRDRIDPRLEAQGWAVVPFSETAPFSGYPAHALTEFPTTNGPADYALVVDGQMLGVVEAKRLSIGPHGALTQAERYSRGVSDSPFNFRGLRVPFLYSTNGEVLWFHDARDPLNRSRQVARFHTPAALREFLDRDFSASCGWFATNPNRHPLLRPYQIDANTAVESAMAERKRQMLVAMATGTKKTFTLVNQI